MGLKNILIIAYLDDLMVMSPSFEVHLDDLRQVFQRLQQFGLRANRSKRVCIYPEIRYLGHVITAQGIKPDPEKIVAISQLPPPKHEKQVRAFLQTTLGLRSHSAIGHERMLPGNRDLIKRSLLKD